MDWSLRLLVRRARTQVTILAAVLAVAVVGASLLGTFSLLLTASERTATDAALSRQPAADTDLETVLSIGQRDAAAAVDATHRTLDALTAGMPTAVDDWYQSSPYALPPSSDGGVQLGYVATYPQIEKNATLRSGAWPAAGAPGRLEVAVPTEVATRLGWTVGTTIPMQSTTSRLQSAAVVVGIFDKAGTREFWDRDLLDGAVIDPTFPLPSSFGAVMTTAYGPFITDEQTMRDGTVAVGTVQVVAHPQFGSERPGSLAALHDQLEGASRRLTDDVGTLATSVVFSSRLDASIASAAGHLAVTRVGLVIVGLMLAVLAVTVLLLAARLLAERRTGEQVLLTSRGASPRQLLRVAALEALAVAALAAAAAPWLARALYGYVTSQGTFRAAGLDVDPGLPVTLWATTAAAALLFGTVLLSPLLRRHTSVVDSQQQEIRQDRRGSLTRSGIDVALLALAGVGYWQLRSYHSPVLASGGLDPVLVTGPALLLLAGAAIALRAVPLVAAVAERLAARSRSLVLPLAAWEVGRRPRRASGAVLLLTLAVAISTFSLSFLATWRTSQADQADLSVGTDLQVDGFGTDPLAASGALTALAGDHLVSPVASRSVDLGRAADPGMIANTPTSVSLLAVDASRADSLLRGRAPAGQDWDRLLAPLVPADAIRGTVLPPAATSLTMQVAVNAPQVGGSTSPGVVSSVVVQDANGLRVALDLPVFAADGEPHDLTARLAADDGPPLAGPLTVVGYTAQLLGSVDDPAADVAKILSSPPFDLGYRVTFGRLRASVAGVDTPVELTADQWHARTRADPNERHDGVALAPALSDDGQSVVLNARSDSYALAFGNVGLTATAFDAVPEIPVIVTDALLDKLSFSVGDSIFLSVDGASVTGKISASVPYLPSLVAGSAVLADRDLLSRQLVLAGQADPLLDEWWVSVPASESSALASAVEAAHDTSTTSRYDLRAELTDGPLRIGVQAALWIVTGACLVLAVAGFAMSATVSVRLRRLEFARLQALGASRRGLARAVLAEHGLLAGLGLGAGLAIGVVLARLVAPLLAVGPDGSVPIPSVVVRWPWAHEAAATALLVGLIVVTVTVTATTLLRRASSELLRLGDDR